MTETTGKPRSGRPRPIDPLNFGGNPLLSENDITRVVASTGLKLLEEVDSNKFGRCLNDIVVDTMIKQLTIRLTKNTVGKLRRSIETYRDLSCSLAHCEFYPPPPPSEWMMHVEAWLKKAEHGLVKRSKSGAPKNLELQFFLPRTLGLIHAGFGIQPDASISRLSHDGTGAAFRFIKSTYESVSEAIAERGFSEIVHRDLAKKAEWHPPEDKALGYRLRTALTYKSDTMNWREVGPRDIETSLSATIIESRTELAWRNHSRLYQKNIVKI